MRFILLSLLSILIVCRIFIEVKLVSYPKLLDEIYLKNGERISIYKQKDNYLIVRNNELLFDTKDVYRLIEVMVYPPVIGLEKPEILFIGNDPGFFCQEILKVEPESIEYLPANFEVFKFYIKSQTLSKWNFIFKTGKVKLIQKLTLSKKYDVIYLFANILFDSKYFKSEFLHLISNLLKEKGRICIKFISPFFARRAVSLLYKKLVGLGFKVLPLKVTIDSLCECGGFILSRYKLPQKWDEKFRTKYLNKRIYKSLFKLGRDESIINVNKNYSLRNLMQYLNDELNEKL